MPGRQVALGRLAGPLIVFGVALAISAASLLRTRQLGYLGGLTDEYFGLGVKLRLTGTLGPAAGEPSAFRAPGYPAFVAAVVALAAPDPASVTAAEFDRRAQRAVFAAQCVALAAAAALFFVWLRDAAPPLGAALGAVAFGANPYSVMSTGLLHYGVLHLPLLVASGLALWRALRGGGRPAALVAAGALSGLANLVKPVTLLLAPILLFHALVQPRSARRRALLGAATFAASMLVVILPWTVRNLAVTGRLVPVNDNAWTTLWGHTVKPLPRRTSRYVWFDLYQRHFMPVFMRVTESPAYDYVAQNRRNRELEAAFRAEALANLARQPGVYLGNVASAFASLNAEMPVVLLQAWTCLQRLGREGPPGVAAPVPQEWFWSGLGEDVCPAGASKAFGIVAAVLTALAFIGLAVGLWRRDPFVLVPLALHLAVSATQALFFTHLLHYYVRLLPLFLLGFYGAGAASARIGRRATLGLQALLTASCLVLTAVLA